MKKTSPSFFTRASIGRLPVRLRWVGVLAATALIISVASRMRADNQPPSAKPKAKRPYCVDWPKPDFVLFITGRQHGYIEPCGCTGLEFQKGGLARRQTLYRELVGRGWDVVPIDVGNQVRRFGQQAAIKFQTTMNALRGMNYAAVGLGPDDLRLDVGDLVSEIFDEQTPLVCANLTVADFPVSDGHKIVEVGPHRVGITAIVGEKEQQGIRNDELKFTKPLEALQSIHKQLVNRCNLMVLLSHASSEESLRLAQANAQTQDFRIVVTAGGADEPALQPERIRGTKSYLVQTGKKGMYVGVLGIYADDPENPIRYERVPLDARFKDSPEVLKSLAGYQKELESLYKQGWDRLGLRPVQHPGGGFAGSAACADCHEAAYEKWKTTPHHLATKHIVEPGERSSISRHFDPECLSCHVTGWNPQNYFPYKTGYTSLEASRDLHGNGCENCHGPGAEHVAVESGERSVSDERQAELVAQMRLPLDQAEQTCLKCHDLDNDPHFQEDGAFQRYWKQIEHYE